LPEKANAAAQTRTLPKGVGGEKMFRFRVT
jgi:hypothetical protein